MAVPKKKKYKLVLNSDDVCYGGNGNAVPEELTAAAESFHYHDYSVTLDLPPYTAVVYQF